MTNKTTGGLAASLSGNNASACMRRTYSFKVLKFNVQGMPGLL
jgi:hypothetical protein